MKRIVLVDDDENLLKVYKFFLSKEGFEVITFINSNETLRYLSGGQTVDLFILDIELPDLSGLDLMEEIRKNSVYSKIPIIISSSYEHYKNNFTSWLASDYHVKQPDISDLKSKVKSLLQ
jgi:DNA-binding response OmpR family regulator